MTTPPPVARWLQDGFHLFLKGFLRRHFHTIAIHRASSNVATVPASAPLIIYGNHPSWWDPLVAHFLCCHYFVSRQFYAPIDASALEQYSVFKKLGFFGVDLTSTRGAVDFLKTSLAILDHPGTSLWITPEGRFTDCRDQSVELMPGLPHLCTRMPAKTLVVPMAVEYVFWEERLPECLIGIGEPVSAATAEQGDVSKNKSAEGAAHARNKLQWRDRLNEALRAVQRRLAEDVIARRADRFTPLLSGDQGAGGFYDSLRRVRGLATGRPWRREHGSKFR